MDESEWLADRFDEHRAHLRAAAYRMLGSLSDADDALQDAWLRLSRSGTGEVENLGGWLTTIVARVCLNMLRSRKVRARSPSACACPILSSARTRSCSRRKRRCWPTRLALRCSSCSMPWPRGEAGVRSA